MHRVAIFLLAFLFTVCGQELRLSAGAVDFQLFAGLALPFAVAMARRTGVPVGLVPCAHGGTSMTQWDPASRDPYCNLTDQAAMGALALSSLPSNSSQC